MRMLLEDARNQEGTLGRGHLRHMQGINDVEVELDGLRPACRRKSSNTRNAARQETGSPSPR
jgi:hypothetical protein